MLLLLLLLLLWWWCLVLEEVEEEELSPLSHCSLLSRCARLSLDPFVIHPSASILSSRGGRRGRFSFPVLSVGSLLPRNSRPAPLRCGYSLVYSRRSLGPLVTPAPLLLLLVVALLLPPAPAGLRSVGRWSRGAGRGSVLGGAAVIWAVVTVAAVGVGVCGG